MDLLSTKRTVVSAICFAQNVVAALMESVTAEEECDISVGVIDVLETNSALFVVILGETLIHKSMHRSLNIVSVFH